MRGEGLPPVLLHSNESCSGGARVRGEDCLLPLLAVGAKQGVRHHDPLAAAAAVVHPLAHEGENAALEGGLQQPVQLLLRVSRSRGRAAAAGAAPTPCRRRARVAEGTRVSRSPPWQGRLLEASGKAGGGEGGQWSEAGGIALSHGASQTTRPSSTTTRACAAYGCGVEPAFGSAPRPPTPPKMRPASAAEPLPSASKAERSALTSHLESRPFARCTSRGGACGAAGSEISAVRSRSPRSVVACRLRRHATGLLTTGSSSKGLTASSPAIRAMNFDGGSAVMRIRRRWRWGAGKSKAWSQTHCEHAHREWQHS